MRTQSVTDLKLAVQFLVQREAIERERFEELMTKNAGKLKFAAHGKESKFVR
jgi:hypothetical protein